MGELIDPDTLELKISITDDDLPFKEILYAGSHNCICSRCACLIKEGMFSIIFESKEGIGKRQYRYHPSCVSLDDWFLD